MTTILKYVLIASLAVFAFEVANASAAECPTFRINGEEVEIKAINLRTKPVEKPTEPEVVPPMTGPRFDFYDYNQDGVLDYGNTGCVYDPYNEPYSAVCYD